MTHQSLSGSESSAWEVVESLLLLYSQRSLVDKVFLSIILPPRVFSTPWRLGHCQGCLRPTPEGTHVGPASPQKAGAGDPRDRTSASPL